PEFGRVATVARRVPVAADLDRQGILVYALLRVVPVAAVAGGGFQLFQLVGVFFVPFGQCIAAAAILGVLDLRAVLVQLIIVVIAYAFGGGFEFVGQRGAFFAQLLQSFIVHVQRGDHCADTFHLGVCLVECVVFGFHGGGSPGLVEVNTLERYQGAGFDLYQLGQIQQCFGLLRVGFAPGSRVRRVAIVGGFLCLQG